MSVVPSTQLRLARERRQFKHLVNEHCWGELLQQDEELMKAVADASEDPERDLESLLSEMKVVVSSYRNLLDSCSQQMQRYAVCD